MTREDFAKRCNEIAAMTPQRTLWRRLMQWLYRFERR
jgi:hypothetical protein